MKTINDYLDNKLSPKDDERATAQLFRANFASDRRERQNKWATRLADEQQLTRKSAPPLIRRLRPWLAVAAGILLLVAVGYLQLSTPLSFEQQLEQQLADQYGEGNSRKNVEGSMGEREGIARAAFNEKNFAQAAALWSALATEYPETVEYGLFHGLSLLYQEPPQTARAVAVFKEILPAAGSRKQEEIRWYLALALLKSGDEIEGRRTLEYIIAEQHWKAASAEELLESMNQE